MSITRALQDVSPGDPITAARFNKVQRLASAVRTSGAGMTIGGNDYFRSIATVAEGGIKTVQFVIQSVGNNHLIGYEAEDEDQTEVFVAKPYMLRTNPWHGNTWTIRGKQITYTYQDIDYRLATSPDETDENQYIVQPYSVGNRLWVVRTREPTDVIEVDEAEGEIHRYDMNVDGRNWGYLVPEV